VFKKYKLLFISQNRLESESLLPSTLVSLFLRKELGSQTKKIIDNIRTSEPSRRVGSGRKNVPGFYPSKKMGVTIQFESHTVELAGIYEKEHDPNVYEYYDQPPSFPIRYVIDGKRRGHSYTADFFTISEEFIGWEEWKKEEELIQLSIEKPHLYVRGNDGAWYMPPAQEYAEQYGLSFRVRSSKDLDWVYIRNLKFLEDYLLSEELRVNDDSKTLLLKKVEDTPGIILKELLEDQNGYSSDDIYKLIASDQIYFDIHRHPIAEYDKAKLFSNIELAKAYSFLDIPINKKPYSPNQIEVIPGNKIQWDGRAWVIVNVGENEISLLSEESKKDVDLPHDVFQYLIREGKVKGLSTSSNNSPKEKAFDILRTASKEKLAKAIFRYNIIKPLIDGDKDIKIEVSERTLRDWKAKYKKGVEQYGYGFIGLLQNGNPGNHNRKISTEVIELTNTYITEHLETIVNKKAYSVWKMLITECSLKVYDPPSFQTFLNEIEKRPVYEHELKREGKKAAYNKEPRFLVLHLMTPRHGDRPFEICHLDHTQLDIELVCSKTKKNLGRPWVTFLVDAFSRKILALYLTFDEPGYRSVMMVLRECVRRHSRLPANIVIDGGKEFGSTYFETLLAMYEVGKKVREGKPKYGAVVERLFGTTNTMFIYNLLGNTQLMKNVRQVTPQVNPKKHAVWTFASFNEILMQWAYEIYDTIEHPALGQSPRDEFLTGIANAGSRPSTFVANDETFHMLTLPSTKKGTAKVVPGIGVKINHIYYWSESLLDPEIEGKQVPVRYDPFNFGIAYAYVNNVWVYLNSEHFSVFADRTEREVQQALEELKRRMRLRGEEIMISAAKIANFLKSVESEEILLLQRLRDDETKRAFQVIDGGKTTKQNSKSTTKGSKENLDSSPLKVITSKINGKHSSTGTETSKPKYRNFGEF
jgi:putative transposase